MFNDSDDVVDKLVKFMLYLIPLCMVILMVMLLLWGLGVFNPSDKEISTSTENYIEIQLGKEYQLKYLGVRIYHTR